MASKARTNELKTQLATTELTRKRIHDRVLTCLKISNTIEEDPTAIDKFKTRASRLKDSLSEYEALVKTCYEIELELNPEEINQEMYSEMLETFEDAYYQIMGVYESHFKEAPKESATMLSEFLEKSGFLNSQQSAQQTHVRLPPIELKSFDGTIKNWPEFKSNFEALIHHNETLSKTAKFHYLRNSVIGPALALVKELPLTEPNYDIAWVTLNKQYENQRILAADLLNKILKFPSIKRENEIELAQFVTTFSECYTALQALPIQNLSNFIMLHLGLKCLPPGTQKAFERTRDSETMPEVEDLISFVRKQNQVMSLVDLGESSSKDFQKVKLFSKGTTVSNSRQIYTSVSDFQQKSDANDQRPLYCPCCKENHKLFYCPNFRKMHVQERRQFVNTNHFCFNCLSSKHQVKTCTSKFSCKECQKRHCTLLHLDSSTNFSHLTTESSTDALAHNLPNESQKMSRKLVTGSPDPTQQLQAANIVPSHIHTANATLQKTTCILQTAKVLVKNAAGIFVPVRALIDGGAMTSFITTACANYLGLVPTEESSNISGLACQPIRDTKGTVSCVIKSRFDSQPVLSTTAIVLDRITGNLPNVPLPSSLLRPFKKLKLADPSLLTPAPVDLLIAADLFPFIYTGRKMIISDNAPVALASIYGWVITGKSSNSSIVCPFCDESHPLFSCQAFKDVSVETRRAFIKSKQLCYNCLSKSHVVSNCQSEYSCKTCQNRHHSLLHETSQNDSSQLSANN